MSESRWCDSCDKPFSALDEDARRINIEEPEVVNGIRRGTVTVQRDQCGECMRRQAKRARERQAARQLTREGHTGEHGTEATSRGSKTVRDDQEDRDRSTRWDPGR